MRGESAEKRKGQVDINIGDTVELTSNVDVSPGTSKNERVLGKGSQGEVMELGGVKGEENEYYLVNLPEGKYFLSPAEFKKIAQIQSEVNSNEDLINNLREVANECSGLIDQIANYGMRSINSEGLIGIRDRLTGVIGYVEKVEEKA